MILLACKSSCQTLSSKLISHPSYGTEPAVGRAIKKSGIPRDDIFITTKLWNNSHNPEDVEPALNASLKDLDVEYVDLYLIHWPSPFKSGDALFPKDSNGKNLTGDADYIEVRFHAFFLSSCPLVESDQ